MLEQLCVGYASEGSPKNSPQTKIKPTAPAIAIESFDCNARYKNRFEKAVATSNPKAISVVPFKKSKMQSRRLNKDLSWFLKKNRFNGLIDIQRAPTANERRSTTLPSNNLKPSHNEGRWQRANWSAYDLCMFLKNEISTNDICDWYPNNRAAHNQADFF